MKTPPRIITLTTDFGTSDAYVGVMKGVILGINPRAQVVDITHAIPPQDIHEAAFLIHSAHRYFPKDTIHTIVVDPGVGSNRRAIVCQTDNAFFVCPDNGVLSYLVGGEPSSIDAKPAGKPSGPNASAVTIENPTYLLPHVSNTFHGRDIFAPVAAHLSLGVPLADIGTPVHNLVQLSIPTMHIADDTLSGEIIKVDSFGNLITNISQADFVAFTETVSSYTIQAGDVCINRLNRAYAESDTGEPLAIIGSFGLLEIAVNCGSAEERLGLKRGDAVIIRKKPSQRVGRGTGSRYVVTA